MLKSVTSLTADVQFWDRVISEQKSQVSLKELAEMEKERAWAYTRLSNQLDQQGGWAPRSWTGRVA